MKHAPRPRAHNVGSPLIGFIVIPGVIFICDYTSISPDTHFFHHNMRLMIRHR